MAESSDREERVRRREAVTHQSAGALAHPRPGDRHRDIAGDATIRNTGHDILVTPAGDAGKITIGGKVYKLLQFHFHVPSEHSIPGVAAVAEMHIVHQLVKGSGDEYAVIGVMLTKGNEYPALKPVFANLPEIVCAAPKALLSIEFDQLLPKTKFSYYTYAGSLTTPPCTQSVIWYVLGTPQTVLKSDWEKASRARCERPTHSDQSATIARHLRPSAINQTGCVRA